MSEQFPEEFPATPAQRAQVRQEAAALVDRMEAEVAELRAELTVASRELAALREQADQVRTEVNTMVAVVVAQRDEALDTVDRVAAAVEPWDEGVQARLAGALRGPSPTIEPM